MAFNRFSRSKYFLIIGFILVVSSYLYWEKERTMEYNAYKYLSQLPFNFVIPCQQAGTKFGLPWEMLAALYQVRFESGSISAYPDFNEITETATRLSSATTDSTSKNALNQLGYTKDLATQIINRTKLLQRASYLLSEEYRFPYKDKYWYTDTWGADREGGNRKHEGTDIFAAEGTPVYSVSSGTIENLGWNRLGGERVGIRGKDKTYFYYAHLAKINPELKIGQEIAAGTSIGYTGHTGDAISTPDHLHFGIELPNGKWINPFNLLRYWETSTKQQ